MSGRFIAAFGAVMITVAGAAACSAEDAGRDQRTSSDGPAPAGAGGASAAGGTAALSPSSPTFAGGAAGISAGGSGSPPQDWLPAVTPVRRGTGGSVPVTPDAGDGDTTAASCAVTPPERFVVPGAGSGVFSGCAPRACAGRPVGSDLSSTYHEDNPASHFAGCTTVDGTAVIAMDPGTDLSPLACLERVTGDFIVWNNPGLLTLHGLESLAIVQGTFSIGYLDSLSASNDKLQRLDAVSNLRVVGKDLSVDVEQPAESLKGFDSVVAIGRDLNIHSHDPLSAGMKDPDLSGFNALEAINGNLNFEDARAIKTVSGFRALRAIGGSFTLAGAGDLVTLSAFPELRCIGKNFVVTAEYLANNPVLETLGPFPKLERIEGWVRIDKNPRLSSLSLFDTVSAVEGGTIRIAENPLLATLPLGALRTVNDDIIVSDSPQLPTCPLLDLKARLQKAGWTHQMILDGDAPCAVPASSP